MSSVFGSIFKVSTFGESHGKALGCIIDGCPAGIALDEKDFLNDMGRRRPGAEFTSKRQEKDDVEILSGTFEEKTTGTPIALVIRNKNQKSDDYDCLERLYRPGHADYTYLSKYGIRDHRGGGRSSGRETVARVAAGVVAKKILSEVGVSVHAHVSAIGHVDTMGTNFAESAEATELIRRCADEGDSIGSKVTCRIKGLKPGIGSPVFDKLSADLAKAMMSIGGAAGIEFGAGFEVVCRKASENNDGFSVEKSKNAKIIKTSNNSGGIMGGISDGCDIFFNIAFKPPSSIALPQHTADYNGNDVQINIKGRHDPVIAPRACVVAEAMAAIVTVNHIFLSFSDSIDCVKQAYFR